MNLDYFDKIWLSHEKAGMKNADKMWDARASEFNKMGKDERVDIIMGLLQEKDMLNHNSTVLDVGCGPGKFVLEFAKKARHVVGVDISPKMLEYAKENSVAAGFDNTEFKEMDWEAADLTAMGWNKKFSLVVGIMSPAFWSRIGLEKMIEASNEYGMICHFVERQDSIGDELRKEIFSDYKRDEFGSKGLYCSLNILWLYKLYPEISYFDTNRTEIRTVKEMAENFISKYEIRKGMTASQKDRVYSFLESKAVDGVIRDETKAKIACICWKSR
jgi:SAM-dependent methyltransferase